MCWSGVAHAQSLVDVANKEKKRRTEVDGRLEGDLGARLGPGTLDRRFRRLRRPTGSVAEDTGGESAEDQTEADETKTREYWQSRVAESKKKIADLESKLQSPENDWGGGMRTDVNPVGQRNLSGRQEMLKASSPVPGPNLQKSRMKRAAQECQPAGFASSGKDNDGEYYFGPAGASR